MEVKETSLSEKMETRTPNVVDKIFLYGDVREAVLRLNKLTDKIDRKLFDISVNEDRHDFGVGMLAFKKMIRKGIDEIFGEKLTKQS